MKKIRWEKIESTTLQVSGYILANTRRRATVGLLLDQHVVGLDGRPDLYLNYIT